MERLIGIRLRVFKDLGPSWHNGEDPVNNRIADEEILEVLESLMKEGKIPLPGKDDYLFLEEIIFEKRDGRLPVLEVYGQAFPIDRTVTIRN